MGSFTYSINGENLLLEGISPNFWRPVTENDLANGTLKRCGVWKTAADSLTMVYTKVNGMDVTGNVSLNVGDFVQVKFSLLRECGEVFSDIITYNVLNGGVLEVSSSFIPSNSFTLPEMPRFGVKMVLKGEYDNMKWYGRGPHENYWDRKSSSDIDVYSGSVWEQYFPYVRAQESGNKSDVRWSSFTNNSGVGVVVVAANEPIGISAYNFPMNVLCYEDNKGKIHGASVQKHDMVWVNIDHLLMGVGGDNTWGAQTHTEYTITPNEKDFKFYIIPQIKKQ